MGELKEELGVTVQPQDLILCGQRSFQFSAVFHGKPFKDNQVSNCLLYTSWQHRTIPALRLKHRSGSCGTASALPKCSIM